MPPKKSGGRRSSSSTGGSQRRHASSSVSPSHSHSRSYSRHGSSSHGLPGAEARIRNHPNSGLSYSYEPTHTYHRRHGGGGMGLRAENYDNSARFTPASQHARSNELQQILAKNYHAAHPNDVHAQLEDSLLDSQFRSKNRRSDDSAMNHDIDPNWISEVDHVAFEKARRYRPTNPHLDNFPTSILDRIHLEKNSIMPGQERFQTPDLDFPQYPKHTINVTTDDSRFRHALPPISRNDTDTGSSRFDLFGHEQKDNISEGRFGHGKPSDGGADKYRPEKMGEDDRLRLLSKQHREEAKDSRGAYREEQRRIDHQKKSARDMMYELLHKGKPLWWIRVWNETVLASKTFDPNYKVLGTATYNQSRRMDSKGAHWRNILSQAHKDQIARMASPEYKLQQLEEFNFNRNLHEYNRSHEEPFHIHHLDKKLHNLRSQTDELRKLQLKVQDLRKQHHLDKEKRLEMARKERQNLTARFHDPMEQRVKEEEKEQKKRSG